MQIVEVGVGNKNTIETNALWEKASKIILFEPNPFYFIDLCNFVKNDNRIIIYSYAISNEDKLRDFILAGQSSCLSHLYTPLQVHLEMQANNIYKNRTIKVNTFRFFHFDNGKINFLHLSCEGTEWFILNNLISRPEIITIRFYNQDNYLLNYSHDIFGWLNYNNYNFTCDYNNNLLTAHRK